MSFTVAPIRSLETIWAKQGWRQMTFQSAFGAMSSAGVIYRPKEFDGSRKGQTLVYNYTGKLMQPGLNSTQTLDGNEEALNLGNFEMRFDEVRLGVLNPNDDDTVQGMQTSINFEEEARAQLMQAATEKMDYSLFNQLAGNTATSMTLGGIYYSGGNLQNVTGLNPVTTPSATRILRPNGQTTDQALTSSDKMTLTLLDYAVELLMNSPQQTGYLENGKLGQLWISFEQLTDLKQDVNSPITWYSNALAETTGGDNSYLQGKIFYKNQFKPVGTYAGIDIFVSPRVSYGVNSGTNAPITTVRRAVLVTKDALSYASRTGRGYNTDGNVPVVFKVQLKDYEHWKGIEARTIYGLKKNTPSNGIDIGTVVISTYAAAHA